MTALARSGNMMSANLDLNVFRFQIYKSQIQIKLTNECVLEHTIIHKSDFNFRIFRP